MNYDPLPGTHIESAIKHAYKLATSSGQRQQFVFNDSSIVVLPEITLEENVSRAKTALGITDEPFHPQTAKDALARWDKGESVFSIEMGGLGPSYEQAIQILIFELIRDNAEKPLPEPKSADAETWGDATVSRIDEDCGGFSGAQVGAARSVAYRAIRDGWEKMLESAPQDRRIQVSKSFPSLTTK